MLMESSGGETMAMGVKQLPTPDQMKSAKSALDNIVGNLWQTRQESSGSSVGNQSPRNGEDLSDAEGEHEANSHDEAAVRHRDSSPEDNQNGQVRLKDPRHLIEGKINGDSEEKEFDPRSILANLPPLPALEAFNKHRDFLTNPQSLLAGLAAGQGRVPFTAASLASMGMTGFQPPHTTFSPLSGGLPTPPSMAPSGTPARPPSQPTTPLSQQSSSPIQQNFSSQQNWSFEEQFKQLYEIDDNPKRKEFLDELFTMMQKRDGLYHEHRNWLRANRIQSGTPINRLPIMAKQVLDLYELYNLVCARGGLVEVINKKLWQEVIKGLGLPSSITSAAFTLRTQYTKYLYPYECVKRNLSNPNELAAAIEGNKREGRRGSYGAYPEMAMAGLHPSQMSQMQPSQISPMSLVTGPRFNGNATSHHGSPMPPTSQSPINGLGHDPHSSLEQTRMALLKMFGAAPPVSLPNLPPLPGLPADIFQQAQKQQDNALNLHLQRQRAMDEATRQAKDHILNTRLVGEESEDEALEGEEDTKKSEYAGSTHNDNSISPPPPMQAITAAPPQAATGLTAPSIGGKKRHRSQDSEDVEEVNVSSPKKHNSSHRPLGLPGANIKIENRGDGRNGDSSLVVSLEINGTTFQGVLFAQPGKHRTATSS